MSVQYDPSTAYDSELLYDGSGGEAPVAEEARQGGGQSKRSRRRRRLLERRRQEQERQAEILALAQPPEPPPEVLTELPQDPRPVEPLFTEWGWPWTEPPPAPEAPAADWMEPLLPAAYAEVVDPREESILAPFDAIDEEDELLIEAEILGLPLEALL